MTPQHYRFRVETSEGGELLSEVAQAGRKLVDLPVRRITVSIKAQKQGALPQIAAEQLDYAVVDQHARHPVKFMAPIGPATPQLYAALAQNENLPQVIFDCYGLTGGHYALAATVKLTNAAVADVDLRDDREHVAMVFEKIEITGCAAAATAS